jgi:hypothetical protein
VKSKDLPERWLQRLERYTDEKYGPDYRHRGRLGASDFPSSGCVRLRFPDGSYAVFRYAFTLSAPEIDELGVFTEHCGYHVFALPDLEVEHLEDTWSRFAKGPVRSARWNQAGRFGERPPNNAFHRSARSRVHPLQSVPSRARWTPAFGVW